MIYAALILLATVGVYLFKANKGFKVNDIEFFTQGLKEGFGGKVTRKSNSFTFESRVKKMNTSGHKSNKALIGCHVKNDYVNGHKTSFEFDLTINKYNKSNNPDWMLIFQDWVQIDPSSNLGNKPISTLHLVMKNGKIYLQHRQCSYQLKNNFDPTKKHPASKVEGEAIIDIGTTYNIKVDLIDGTDDSGGMSLTVNNKPVSSAKYQTKALGRVKSNSLMWGIYHAYEYDLNYSTYNKIELSINNFNVSI